MKAVDPGSAPRNAAGPSPWRSRFWWWIIVAFALQFAAWTVWIIVATHHPIEEVPIVTDANQRAD